MSMERSFELDGLPRWTLNQRGLPENKTRNGRDFIRDGGLVYQAEEGEIIETPREVAGGFEVWIDNSGGARQDLIVYHLRREATGLGLAVARAQNWFDGTALGRWWGASYQSDKGR